MQLVNKTMLRMVAIACLSAFVLSSYGCSAPKDQSGNGSGTYYTGPMQKKGVKDAGTEPTKK